MTMFKKILWAILELITMGGGTYGFVVAMTNEYEVSQEEAGLGAFLIVVGLLLRNWRLTLFTKNETSSDSKQKKIESASSTNLIVILILAFSVATLFRKVGDVQEIGNTNSYDIDEINSKIGNISDVESDIESLQERIDDLEGSSHSHYY